MPAGLLHSRGLREITFADKPVFEWFLTRCPAPLSDYSFANTFIWLGSH